MEEVTQNQATLNRVLDQKVMGMALRTGPVVRVKDPFLVVLGGAHRAVQMVVEGQGPEALLWVKDLDLEVLQWVKGLVLEALQGVGGLVLEVLQVAIGQCLEVQELQTQGQGASEEETALGRIPLATELLAPTGVTIQDRLVLKVVGVQAQEALVLKVPLAQNL